jgi:spermidine synthase
MGTLGALSLLTFRAVGESLKGSDLWVVALANFGLLLIPTTLMGMTLPLMCQSLRMNNSTIGKQFSVLYAVNTLGAALGALLATYLLIGYCGLVGATLAAAILNIVLGLAAFVVIRRYRIDDARGTGVHSEEPSISSSVPTTRTLVIICSLLCGFVALGYQLVWYRLLTLLLHGTVYVFGTILFMFLCGIAFGAWSARRWTDSGNPLVRFASAQFGISAYVLLFSIILSYGSSLPGLRHMLGATSFTTFHPAPELLAGNVSLRSIYSLLDTGVWAFAFVGIPTFLMGYGFPQLMRAGTAVVSHLGRSVGQIYLANIIGSTLGCLLVGFVLLHHLGSESTLRILVVLGGVTGLFAIIRIGSNRTASAAVRHAGLLWVGFAVVLAAAAFFPSKHSLLRAVHYADFKQVDFIAAEDRSGVVVLRTQHDIISFPIESKVLGVQRLLIDGSAHGVFQSDWHDLVIDSAVRLALSAHRSPKRVLSIGLGDGNMCAAVVTQPEVEELLVVELNGSLADVLAKTPQGRAIFASDKLHLIVDDGRRWLLANSDAKFDVILMWPLHAAHAHSGNLYSQEFFELVQSHLADGGLLFTRSADRYSTARTIASVFDQVVRIDNGAYVASDTRFAFSARRAGLTESEIEKRLEADQETILNETRLAPLNRDFRPNSEYYLTYPYADALQTWGHVTQTYRTADTTRFADLIGP